MQSIETCICLSANLFRIALTSLNQSMNLPDLGGAPKLATD